MKISSIKAKGRLACRTLQLSLLKEFPELTPDDIRVTPSSVNGPDLMLSTRAKELIPFAFEVKNRERLNIWSAIDQCQANTLKDEMGVVIFTRNRRANYAAMEVETFLSLLRQGRK